MGLNFSKKIDCFDGQYSREISIIQNKRKNRKQRVFTVFGVPSKDDDNPNTILIKQSPKKRTIILNEN